MENVFHTDWKAATKIGLRQAFLLLVEAIKLWKKKRYMILNLSRSK